MPATTVVNDTLALTVLSRNTECSISRAPERDALAFAALLDSALNSQPDDAIEDAMYRCAELMGGLHDEGYVATLQAYLDAAEDDLTAHGCEIGPVPKPHQWERDLARSSAAWEWLTAARALMQGASA